MTYYHSGPATKPYDPSVSGGVPSGESKGLSIVGSSQAGELTMKHPALSVVIPVYNRATTVRQAVESALEQRYAGSYEGD
jgi:hypothetical protein